MKHMNRGFALVELFLIVVVVALLTAVVLPGRRFVNAG